MAAISLTPNEIIVRDILKKHLGNRATILKVKQEEDRVTVEVISPNEFSWTAKTLDVAALEAANSVGSSIDLKLSTSWPKE